MKCVECGNEISSRSKFCKYCGAPAVHSPGGVKKGENGLKSSPDQVIIKQDREYKGKFERLWNAIVLFLSAALLAVAGLNFIYVKNEYGKDDIDQEIVRGEPDNAAPVLSEVSKEEPQIGQEQEAGHANAVEQGQKNDSPERADEQLSDDKTGVDEADLPGQVPNEEKTSQTDAQEHTNAAQYDPEPISDEEGVLPEYILVDSDRRYISESELENLTKEQLKLARNELYARHGRRFEDVGIRNYFSQFEWYRPTIEPDDFEESMLNSYEIANRDLIVQYEKAHGYR